MWSHGFGLSPPNHNIFRGFLQDFIPINHREISRHWQIRDTNKFHSYGKVFSHRCLGLWFLASFTDQLLMLYWGWNLSLFPWLVFPAVLFCSASGTNGGCLVYAKASVKLIYISEIFLVWRLMWKGISSSQPAVYKFRVSTVRMEDEWDRPCPQVKYSSRRKVNLFFIEHVFSEYFPYAKLSARVGDIKLRPISALKDLTPL